MLQVMDQISGLANQITEVSSRLNQFSSSTVRKEDLRGEIDSAIRSTLHRELRDLRDFREDMRVQGNNKRSSDYSASPASRSHFASPNPANAGFEHRSASRHEGRKPFDAPQTRDNAAMYSPAGSELSNSGGHQTNSRSETQPNHQHYVSRKMSVVAIDQRIKDFDPLAGQLSMPLHHETAAHKLLIAWDAIHPFYEGILSFEYAQNYVMREETQRGNLRIFAQGEGSDGMGKNHPSLEKQSSQSEYGGSNASTMSSSDGNWGIGYDGPTMPAFDTVGGLNMDGSLCLDPATLARHYESFLSTIWIMHPFLNKVRLQGAFEAFLERNAYEYSAGSTSSLQSPPASAKQQPDMYAQFKASKRKRSDTGFDDKRTAGTAKEAAESFRNPLERSINNALMLLIFALGNICEHREPLPPPVTDDNASSSFAIPKSPSHANTPRSAATPNFAPESATPDATGRSPFSDQSGRGVGRARNIDKIPGLAYFAYAVGILGEHHGSPSLPHVQSCLLAGLYLGQLARVIDSWRWINTACTDCQLLFKDERYACPYATR